MPSFRCTLVAVAIVFTSGGVARANGKGDARAEALFTEGRRLMAAGDFAAACPKFADSQAIEPAPGTALNLATCYEKAGKLASAWAAFHTAQAVAQTAKQVDRARAAAKRADKLEPTLSHLIISVSPEAQVPGLEVRCDGEPVRQPEWGVAVPLDGGGHDIEASAPGKKTWKTHVELAASRQDLSVDLPALESEAPPPPPEPSPEPARVASLAAGTTPDVPPDAPKSGGGGLKVAGLAVGAVGLAGIGLGVFAGLKAQSTYKDAADLCKGTPPACPAGSPAFSQRDSAGTWATVSTVSFAAGGAALAGGALLYFVLAPAASTKTTVAVAPSPGGAALSFAGRF
jgi:hypothetical protein